MLGFDQLRGMGPGLEATPQRLTICVWIAFLTSQFMVRLMFPLAVVAGAVPVMAKDVVPVTVTLNVPDCDAWLVAVPR